MGYTMGGGYTNYCVRFALFYCPEIPVSLRWMLMLVEMTCGFFCTFLNCAVSLADFTNPRDFSGG